MNERIILAVDPGLHFGLAIASTEDGILDSCHVDAKRKWKRGRGEQLLGALDYIIGWVEERVDGGVDHVWYEEPTPQSHRSSIVQGKFLAVVNMAAEKLGAHPNVEVVHPSRLKKQIAGKGNAKKHDMVAAANEIAVEYQSPIVNDNEADAVCLAAYAMKHIQNRMAQRRAIELSRTED